MIVVFTGNTSVADVDAIHDASIELARVSPAGIGHLNFVATDNQPGGLDERVRERLIGLLRDDAIVLRASGVVFPGDGFQAAMVRGILSGLILLSRTRAKIRVHASVDTGAKWLLDVLGNESVPTFAELCRTMERARAAAGPARAT